MIWGGFLLSEHVLLLFLLVLLNLCLSAFTWGKFPGSGSCFFYFFFFFLLFCSFTVNVENGTNISCRSTCSICLKLTPGARIQLFLAGGSIELSGIYNSSNGCNQTGSWRLLIGASAGFYWG